jgi:hypothetical protein
MLPDSPNRRWWRKILYSLAVDLQDAAKSTRSVRRQREFNFKGHASEAGYDGWLAGRRLAVEELARRMGLPLGHQVEVWLTGGIRLRGKLRLWEEVIFIEEDRVRHLEMLVDHFSFAYREMESCVRLD